MKLFQYTHQGQRTNNEDYVLAGRQSCVVCDGVGGRDKGEIASRMVAEAFIAATDGKELSREDIAVIIADIQVQLNAFAVAHPAHRGMGTTLAAVTATKHGLYCTHMGDSRIYVIHRAAAEYWVSTDHSLVAELLAQKLITKGEAHNHPRKNTITRAFVADPDSAPHEASIVCVSQLAEGDLVFICSDGVTESFQDEQLLAIFADRDLTAQAMLDMVQERCATFSSDNNTAILLELEAADVCRLLSEDLLDFSPIVPAKEDEHPADDTNLYPQQAAVQVITVLPSEERASVNVQPSNTKLAEQRSSSTPAHKFRLPLILFSGLVAVSLFVWAIKHFTIEKQPVVEPAHHYQPPAIPATASQHTNTYIPPTPPQRASRELGGAKHNAPAQVQRPTAIQSTVSRLHPTSTAVRPKPPTQLVDPAATSEHSTQEIYSPALKTESSRNDNHPEGTTPHQTNKKDTINTNETQH